MIVSLQTFKLMVSPQIVPMPGWLMVVSYSKIQSPISCWWISTHIMNVRKGILDRL
jgi:hypothetical protein